MVRVVLPGETGYVALGLRQGSRLLFQLPRELEVVLQLHGADWAAGTLAISADGSAHLTIKNVDALCTKQQLPETSDYLSAVSQPEQIEENARLS